MYDLVDDRRTVDVMWEWFHLTWQVKYGVRVSGASATFPDAYIRGARSTSTAINVANYTENFLSKNKVGDMRSMLSVGGPCLQQGNECVAVFVVVCVFVTRSCVEYK